jgi:flagellar assembly protein FliH
MERGFLSSQDYQYQKPGYLVDNIPWQVEIKKRLEQEIRVKSTDPHPTLGTEEIQNLVIPEVEEEEEEIPELKPEVPSAEELLEKAKKDAEEKAREIEQSAKKNAFEILERARWEANDVLTKAKDEAEKEIQIMKEAAAENGQREGLEKGRREGFDKGREEGRQTYDDLVRKWNGLVEGIAPERKKLLGELQPLLVELVSKALTLCLKKEAEKSSDLILGLAEEVLKKAQDRVHLKLHLNPADVREVESQKARLQLSVGTGALELMPDARIEKGGCVLETEAGSVDARLSTVVSRIKESLQAELPQA